MTQTLVIDIGPRGNRRRQPERHVTCMGSSVVFDTGGPLLEGMHHLRALDDRLCIHCVETQQDRQRKEMQRSRSLMPVKNLSNIGEEMLFQHSSREGLRPA